MVDKGKGDHMMMMMKPVFSRFGIGVAVAISLAAVLFSRLITTNNLNSSPSPSPSASAADLHSQLGEEEEEDEDDHASQDGIFIEKNVDPLTTAALSPTCKSDDKNGLLLPEFDDLVKGFDDTNVVHPLEKIVATSRTEVNSFGSSEKHDHHQKEIEYLTTMVEVLKERERNLETQLLEFYGLKEQEASVMELQNRLKINNMEAKLLSLKIGSLQAENQSLKAQLAESAKTVTDLNAAKSTVKVLKLKLGHEAEQNKERILALQERVAKLQEHELGSTGNSDDDIEVKLQRLKVIQDEVDELKRANRRLQMENSELSNRLELAQVLANSVLEDHEAQRLRETNDRLLQENENFRKQIEQLQADRYADAEELVYLRWVNACLRYELRNYQPEAGKTAARDLGKALSPRSENKAKQLILEYARSEGMPADIDLENMEFDSDNWSSTPASCITDSAERDHVSSVDISSATKTSSSSSKNKLLSSLRKLVRGKHSHHNSHVSLGKTDYMEQDDSASCRSSTMIDGNTPSHSSYRSSSFDIQRQSFVKAAELNNAETARSKSDLGSFLEHRRLRADGVDVFGNIHDEQGYKEKSGVVKFAQVLKNTLPQKQKVHKKSTSYSFS